ncbi:MAG: hypothetical protein Q9207_006469 [Kuettlingeria erythrocarpa]
MPQEMSSLVADSEIKLQPETALGRFATSKPSMTGTRAAVDGKSKHSAIVHDTRVQGKTLDALLTTWPGMTKSPLPLSVPNPWGSTADPVTLRKKFFQTHGFWPSQTLYPAHMPKEWTRGLLKAFLSIPKHVPLARLRKLLKTVIDERADRRPDDSRVGVSKARQVINLDIATLHRLALWFSPEQAPTSVSTSSVWSSPCSSQGAEHDPAPASSPPVTPLRMIPTPPSVVDGDATATFTPKRTLVNHSDQASSGPASRTKRRRIADGGPNEEPDDSEVRPSGKASLPDHYGVHTPPNETSRDEESLSQESTDMQPEVPWKDGLTSKTDQAGNTAVSGMDTPRSMSRGSGTRLFPVNEASLSVLSSTSAAPAVDHEVNATIDSIIACLPDLPCADGDLLESTLERAILSLRPQQRLTSTCIELLMKTFDSGEMRIIDPAYIDCEKPVPKPHLGKSQAKDLLIPLYHPAGPGHWTLATVVSNKTAYLYDSCPSREITEKVCKALETFRNSQLPAAAASQPSLELLDCKCPRQDNDNDCGIFALVAALHIMAHELVPDSIDTQSWRYIFQAALDESMPVPNITLPSPAELGEYYSLMHSETAQHDGTPENLRGRVELVQSAVKVMESWLITARKACTVLESLADKRKHLHASLLTEESVWMENCASLEAMLDTFSALEYRQTTAQGSLNRAIADARRSRTAATERVQKSSGWLAAIRRASTRAWQFCEQHKYNFEAICVDRSALQARLLEIEGEVQQKSQEYLRFLQALGKECAISSGSSSG